jgi:hypothetical protein
MNGCHLDQVIDTSIGNFWDVTRSQVYRELRNLARSRDTRRRAAYRLNGATMLAAALD